MNPEVFGVAVEHARRGVALQVAVRWVLVAFVGVTVLVVPPPHYRTACLVVAACYAVWAGAVAAWTRRATSVRVAWLALLVDVVVLGVLTLLTGVASPQSWTSDVLTTGFLLIPVLAATQLRPWVCAAVVVPTALVYLLAGIATQAANEEPWTSLLLRTLVIVGVAAGCIGLSRIQRSRVRTIGRLVGVRGALLGELTGLEQRERRALAEHLHDGALQYVLAARLDLDDARETGDVAAFDRLEEALAESSRLLRSTVADLHPAVLEKAGLPAALGDLAAAAGARGGFSATVSAPDWSPTPADPLLYRTARELLANVARHARATSATVTLARADGMARLVVADDGVGMPTGPPDGGAAGAAASGVAGPGSRGDGGAGGAAERGHIGLASHTVRVEAAGGRLVITPAEPHGTVVTVEVPDVPRSTDNGIVQDVDRSMDGIDSAAAAS